MIDKVKACEHLWEDVLAPIPLDGRSTLKPGERVKFVALERCTECGIGRLAEDYFDGAGILHRRRTEVGTLEPPAGGIYQD